MRRDDENNEAPDEIKIVKNELNDSFEPDYEQIRTKVSNKSKSKGRRNYSTRTSIVCPPIFQSAPKSPSLRKNSHIKFDDNGDPVLNLRPMFGVALSESSSTENIDPNANNCGEDKDEEEPFIVVKPNHKRKKKLQKTDSNGLEPEVIGSKVIKSSSSVSSSPSSPSYLVNDCNKGSNTPRVSKYWAQRYRLFSKYDDGILLDEESWYSVTPEKIAKHIAEVCRCGLVVDAFCGVGGNAIQFAMTCDRVIAVDIDQNKIDMARNNARVYGVESKIEFIVGDFFKVVPNLVADAMFLSPPWGGPEYLSKKTYDLQKMGNSMDMDGFNVFSIARKVTPNIAFFVPRNTLVDQLSGLGGGRVKVEKNMMNHKIKTMTAYYGDLVDR